MDYSLKSPCKDCPFVKGNYFAKNKALPVSRVKDILQSSVLGDSGFTCHKTKEGDEKQCAGSLILYNKVNKGGNILHRLATRLGHHNPDSMKNVHTVYDDILTMLKSYK